MKKFLTGSLIRNIKFLTSIPLIIMAVTLENVVGQTSISGRVVETAGTKEVPIPGATIFVPVMQTGVSTDLDGNFTLMVDSLPVEIIAGFIGYASDTIFVTSIQPLQIILRKSIDIKAVEVTAKREDVEISTINPLNAEKITQGELLKAACCNLSEAFETNPSVNVSYKDAVTGVKEIKMLGLGGTYVQMLNENIPDMRGLAGIYGLTYIPGPWIESIQLTKGSGSVVNGYESTTGQINVELKKPFEMQQPRFYLNLFGDEFGGLEANSIIKKQFDKKWSSMLMLHGRRMQNEVDRNKDYFMDQPDNNSFNIYNRWQYNSGKKMQSQLVLKFLKDDIEGGQTEEAMLLHGSHIYMTSVKTMRAEVAGKVGFVFPENPMKSIGNIFQVTYHDMESSFGLKSYNAEERSFYYQGIYQDILWQRNHQFKTGISYRYTFLEQELSGTPGRMRDHVPGIFFEYTYSYLDKFTLVAGAREDLHEEDDFVFTPRLHGKYNFNENFVFRFSVGKSYRKPYVIADNISVLASSRWLDFTERILPERAWNYGVNFTRRFNFLSREFSLSVDAYRTEFVDQLVVDSYSDSSKISFYNLDGESFSNSLQATFNASILENLGLRVSYKLDDVKSTFNGKLEQQPLITRNRALGTLSYNTMNEHWKVDYTFVWEGKKKLQNVLGDERTGRDEFSPAFTVMNLQVTKVFRRFELYGGAENIFDFRQKDPIINPDDPFGNAFDATNIWGPITGRRIYAGIRYSIK